jgi:hypothetical protein
MATLLAAFSSQALAKDGFVGLDWNFNPATSMTIDNPWWPLPENAIFVYVAETEWNDDWVCCRLGSIGCECLGRSKGRLIRD